MILALDVATTTGWAAGPVGANPPLLQWGARNFAGRDGNGEVIAKFRHWLNARCYELRPTLIVFESPYVPFQRNPKKGGPPPMNALTLRRLMALNGLVEEIAWELRIECREATTGEISKFFTGKHRHGGRDAKKAAFIEMCRAHSWDVESDDVADALALWAMAEAIVSPRAASVRGDGLLFLPRNERAPRVPDREALIHTSSDEDQSSHGQPQLI